MFEHHDLAGSSRKKFPKLSHDDKKISQKQLLSDQKLRIFFDLPRGRNIRKLRKMIKRRTRMLTRHPGEQQENANIIHNTEERLHQLLKVPRAILLDPPDQNDAGLRNAG